jgi:hypothetical protein
LKPGGEENSVDAGPIAYTPVRNKGKRVSPLSYIRPREKIDLEAILARYMAF